MKTNLIISLCFCLFIITACSGSTDTKKVPENYLWNAQASLDSLQKNYFTPQSQLSNVSNAHDSVQFYLRAFSATNALLKTTVDRQYLQLFKNQILPGLEKFLDLRPRIPAYASYISKARTSNLNYDENAWIGINFIDLYQITQNQKYLKKAQLTWRFVSTNTNNEVENISSNASASALALKLFEATGDSTYFHQGKSSYEFYSICLNDSIKQANYTHNSGQMIQSAALLYKLTQDSIYLTDAQNLAKTCYEYFFSDFTGKDQKSFKQIKKGNLWYITLMLGGFIELYQLDKDPLYINTFKQNLNYAWQYARNEKGLFQSDFSGETIDNPINLLTQAAMIEMYSRIAHI